MWGVPLPGINGEDARRQLASFLIPIPEAAAAVVVETISTDYLRAFLSEPETIATPSTFTEISSDASEYLTYLRSHLSDPN